MTQDGITVGVVTPHTAPGPEVELPAMTRGRVTTVLVRTGSQRGALHAQPQPAPPAHGLLRASTEHAALERAAVIFQGRALVAVAHASTTSGYVIGKREEAALVDRLAQRFEVPAVASCAAAVQALRTHEISTVQLIHPPWFDDGLDALGGAYFRSHGFDAVVTKADTLPNDPARVEPRRVVTWLEQHLEDRVEAIFLAGNGFLVANAVQQLEAQTGRLVLEANQALLWGVLRATGSNRDIPGHGRLLRACR